MPQVSAPFADIETMLTDATMSMLANVVATPAVGEPFVAMFDVDASEFFDSVRGADYVLRYAVGPVLERGDTLTVSGSPLVADNLVLRVAEKPIALRAGHECAAPLVRAG